MYSRQQLSDDFRALGVVPGETLMVHASVRAVGELAGGPDDIHLALKDALTDDGTLFMYAGCPRYMDEVGRGGLTAEQEAEVLEKCPPFDPETARADRSHGILAEFLRSYPGTRVNAHVARFAAWGRHTDYLFSRQPWDDAFGQGSAFERFVDLDGRILLIGSDHDNVTFLHYAEHIVDIPDKRIARFRVPVLEGGARVWRDMREVDSSNGAHAHWPDDLFSRIVDAHLAETGNHGGRAGNATCYLMPARGLLALALEVMRDIAADPRAADAHPRLQARTRRRAE